MWVKKNNMFTLLQVNVTANWGSTGKIAEAIGLAAMNNGWKSYIAYGRWSNPSQSHLIKVGSKLDMYLHYGEQRFLDNEGLCSRRATKQFIKIIREIKPDIIHLHNIHDHYLNFKLLFEYLNQTDIKVVWTFHDCWAFTGHCFHFIMKNCEKWKTECNNCPLVHEYPNTFLDRSKKNFNLKKQLFIHNRNLTIVPCSEWLEDFVKQSFLKDKKIYVIKNGVDLLIFKPTLSKISPLDGKYRILAVSSVWNKEKGLNDIYKLRNILPDDFVITVVGLNMDQIKNLPSKIIGIQRTQSVHELVDLYSSSDVLINPTYADTFPTVNLEALACGTPVITYRTGGSPETIDVKTGIVVDQGDVISLAGAIRKLRKEHLSSDDCRQRAEMYFDKNKCYDNYIKLYNNLVMPYAR